jgi:hypothetical protein
MRWLVLIIILVGAVGLAGAGCRRGGQENLGLSGAGATVVDVTKLANVDELLRALALSGHELDERLGAHHMGATSKLQLEQAGRERQTLEDTFAVDADGKGAVHLLHDNSRGDGFEAIAVADQLYVKPRYGRYVRTTIESDELSRLRVTAETSAASYLRLLRRWVQVSEAGTQSVAGHAGIKLHLTARVAPEAAPAETEAGRKWRATVQARYVDGDVVLDQKTGAPLSVRLEAAYGFERDGKPLAATLQYNQTTAPAAEAIAAPADFAVLGRARPLLDRQQLLEGLK